MLFFGKIVRGMRQGLLRFLSGLGGVDGGLRRTGIQREVGPTVRAQLSGPNLPRTVVENKA